MNTRTVKRFFAESEVALVHQDGSLLTAPTKGAEAILHFREGEEVPCCAELISGEHYAEIGLWFEGRRLADYDGVFSLPREVAEMLTEADYVVPKDLLA